MNGGEWQGYLANLEVSQRMEEMGCCLDTSIQSLLHLRTWQSPTLTQVNLKGSEPGSRKTSYH